MSLEALEAELLCLICQDRMWCISLAPDAWNLSGHCQATQDAQDAGDVTQDAQDTGEVTQDAQDAGDATQDAQDAGDAKDATQDTQDPQDATALYLTQDNLLLMNIKCLAC